MISHSLHTIHCVLSRRDHKEIEPSADLNKALCNPLQSLNRGYGRFGKTRRQPPFPPRNLRHTVGQFLVETLGVDWRMGEEIRLQTQMGLSGNSVGTLFWGPFDKEPTI